MDEQDITTGIDNLSISQIHKSTLKSFLTLPYKESLEEYHVLEDNVVFKGSWSPEQSGPLEVVFADDTACLMIPYLIQGLQHEQDLEKAFLFVQTLYDLTSNILRNLESTQGQVRSRAQHALNIIILGQPIYESHLQSENEPIRQEAKSILVYIERYFASSAAGS